MRPLWCDLHGRLVHYLNYKIFFAYLKRDNFLCKLDECERTYIYSRFCLSVKTVVAYLSLNGQLLIGKGPCLTSFLYFHFYKVPIRLKVNWKYGRWRNSKPVPRKRMWFQQCLNHIPFLCQTGWEAVRPYVAIKSSQKLTQHLLHKKLQNSPKSDKIWATFCNKICHPKL